MARKRSSRFYLRIFGAVLLVALLAGGWLWWDMHHWQPERGAFPMQGVEIGSEDGAIDWRWRRYRRSQRRSP